MNSNIEVRRWSEQDFINGQEAWQQLHNESTADPLFLSWSWISQWWSIWGKDNAVELFILAAYANNTLIGIAPLYFSSTKMFKGLYTTKRVEFLGSQYRKGLGIRSEYHEFILAKNQEAHVAPLLAQAIYHEKQWHELILPDLKIDSPTEQHLRSFIKNDYQRLEKQDPTYTVDCTGSFDNYLSALGKNTRLKLYNRRKLLEKHGEVRLINIEPQEFDTFLEKVNDFHRQRWSAPCFNSEQSLFLKQLFSNNQGHWQSYCSQLTLDDQCLSAMVNIKVNHCVYNIQLGFAENFDKKIALGTLHLGYVIEKSFADNDVDCFDLLAGQGKHSNYKERIAVSTALLETRQVIRNPLLASIYRGYDAIKQWRK